MMAIAMSKAVLRAVSRVSDTVALFKYLSFRAERNCPLAGDSAESRNLLFCAANAVSRSVSRFMVSRFMVSRFII